MTGDSNRENLAALRHAERLLAAFSHSSAIGFGICDRELRYRCINKTLAASNGMLPEAHLGNTIQGVLGPVADVIDSSFRRVLVTGQVTRWNYTVQCGSTLQISILTSRLSLSMSGIWTKVRMSN